MYKRQAPIGDGYVKMANLAVIGSHSVNGVSALHSVTESDEVARLLQLDSQDTASRGMSTLPAIMEDTLATPRFARYHQAMESADRLITEAMSADKNFELQLLQIQQQLDVALTS